MTDDVGGQPIPSVEASMSAQAGTPSNGADRPTKRTRAFRLPVRPAWVAAVAMVVGLLVASGAQGMVAPEPPSAAPASDQVELSAVADTYVVPSQPRTNFGKRSYVFATTAANRAFVRFDTENAVPADRAVTAATLHVYVMYVATNAPGFEVHGAGSGWAEEGLTNDNRPPHREAVVNGSVPELVRGRWVDIPIEPAAVSASGPTSFELMHRTPHSQLQLATRESGRAPRLRLSLSEPGAPSSTPSPSPSESPSQSPTQTATQTATETATQTATQTPTPSTTAPRPGNGQVLPIDVPAAAASGHSTKLAFAHYFPPYPVSFDNRPPERDYYERNYLEPTGERGVHKASGGALRDRPLGRAPRSGDWRAQDLETEVRQAMAAGLDGFAVDVLSVRSVNWHRTVALMEAAHRVSPSFKIIVMPDMTATGKNSSPQTIADAMAKLARYPAAMRLADGRVVMSPFKAEVRSARWWSEWVDLMRTRHDINVALVPTFLNWSGYADEFASISYGYSTWGNSNPAFNESLARHAARAHRMGKIWAAPVRVQDVRPRSGVYEEAQNTTTLRQTWTAAIAGDADWVFLPTWNDYSEATSFAPSAQHGWSFLDVSSYYLTWWRTGREPTVVRDGLYLSHRTQPYDATPTFPQTTLMKLRPGSTKPRDTVEALVFLTAPATVTLQVGDQVHRWDAPAGLSVHTEPLAPGTVSGRVERDGQVTTSVTSPNRVTRTPYVQDLQYHAVSSLRP
jgi:hypothetical protein